MRYSGTVRLADGSTVAWRSPYCVAQFVAQIDQAWPSRDHGADGTIGDASHVAQGRPCFDPATGVAIPCASTGRRGTDHLPDALGLVVAVDVDHDPAHGCDAKKVGEAIASSRDPRVDYMELENVAAGRKLECSPRTGWRFVDAGPSSAGPHLHVSMLHRLPLVDGQALWQIAAPAPVPVPSVTEDDLMLIPLDDGAVHVSAQLPVCWLADDRTHLLAAHCAKQPFPGGTDALGLYVLGLPRRALRVCGAPSKAGVWVLFEDTSTTGVVFTNGIKVLQ